MSNRREYYKKWREKNRASIREKDKIRHTEKVIGSPNYLERYKKFHRVLQGLITSNENRKDIEYRDFDKAIMEWKDDLEYLENKWMNKSI